jgi:hypothetical protein
VKNWLLILLAGFIALLPCVGSATPIAPDGKQLVAMLDAMNVEHLWLAGEHIDWQSGAPTGKPERVEGKHTHCSAFVASVAERLGVYILRPPEHTQMLLANAQFDWLVDQGAAGGWNELTSSEQAQADANRGDLVVAVYRNHHDDKPGHIAIVRPNEKSASAIADEGPQVTQAGGTNYASTSLAQGFANHPAAWGHKEVRYFAHIVDWKNAHALHRRMSDRMVPDTLMRLQNLSPPTRLASQACSIRAHRQLNSICGDRLVAISTVHDRLHGCNDAPNSPMRARRSMMERSGGSGAGGANL